ncbi:Putative malate dehydrogenase [Echinococcus granulosus]|uniref:Malate dehydrogenase n=1 Tax=Echinococcus granulosus TaxID=6210 RepID=W6UTK1_ECHGR|nr:Putative malate dehydrogenase [Echinococcus granulosus]EUB64628.1 Putative malate dehydrogenase [Echinococcus granulosus]
MLGDKMQRSLPDFFLTKVVIPPNEWDEYSERIARERGWSKMPSPIVWRELVDTGGRVTLIGDARDFQEYANTYYAMLSRLSSHKLLQISIDNQRYTDEAIAARSIKQVMLNTWRKIAIIGAESPTAVRLAMLLAMMQHSSKAQKVKLHLFPGSFVHSDAVVRLKEILDDSACIGLQAVETSVNLTEALENASLVVILDVIPREHPICVDGTLKHSEARSEWLDRRFHYFYRLGECIRQYADQNVRVLVVGSEQTFEGAVTISSPLNFDVQTLHMACKENIPLNNIVGLPRALEYSMKSALARRLGVRRCDIVDLIIWGNIDNVFLVDISQARVHRRHGAVDSETGPAWFSLAAEPLVFDLRELYERIIPEKLERSRWPGTNTAAMRHASAIFSFIKQWQFGYKDPNETITSLVLSSTGHYSVPAGLAFSFPVTTSPMGCFEICQDITVESSKMKVIENCILDTLKDWSVVDPSMLTEFRKEVFPVQSAPKSEAWNYPSATTAVNPAISVESVDQEKREFNAVPVPQKTPKKALA